MKDIFLQKHADFFLILAFFAVPPIMNDEVTSYSASVPVVILLLYAAVCFYILCKCKFGKNDFKFFSLIAAVILFISLFLNAMIWNFIASFFDYFDNNAQIGIQKMMPDIVWEKLYVVLSLFIAALYEELLYRKFLPEEALSILPKSAQCRVPPRMIRFFAELSIILIFALGHRYLGVWAVINAFCAGVILRFFCVRTGSFLSGFVAHFVYNLIVFFLL